ncbi:hypothetical protein BC830DRAFT_1159422 [Chytriomyces sp. MP71]|nr:hypothetical protein BC830DRAFT_1159422 [Chytriomyces sp. MP71]
MSVNKIRQFLVSQNNSQISPERGMDTLETLLLNVLGVNQQNLQAEGICLTPALITAILPCLPPISTVASTTTITTGPANNAQQASQVHQAMTMLQCICKPDSVKGLNVGFTMCAVTYPDLLGIEAQLDYMCNKIETNRACQNAATKMAAACVAYAASGAGNDEAAKSKWICEEHSLVTGYVDKCTDLNGFDAKFKALCHSQATASGTRR